MQPGSGDMPVIQMESTRTKSDAAQSGRVRLFGIEGTKAFWMVLLLLLVGVGLGAGIGLGIFFSQSSSSSDTATALPPLLLSPAPSPPPSPLLPSVHAVSFSIRVAGDLSSFTADVIGELEAAVATRASVAPAVVTAQVTAGSVIVGFTIGSSSSGEASTISSTMASALAGDPSTIFSSVTGAAVAVEAVLSQPTVSSFSTKSGSVSVSVSAVNGIEGRATPEPYKPTRLCAFTDCTLVGGESFTWTIAFMPWADELNPPNVATVTYATGEASSLVHEFTRPGYYNVSIVSQTHGAADSTFNNVYARREIRNLTSSEWGLYVDALWTLMNVSTADGRQRFACPSGRQEDYHTHAFFVALHGAVSANTTCDQFHFSLMQEFAHLGWNTLLEKSMQCVHPSVALTYWNEAYDRRIYYDESLGPKSLLRSPVWNTTYLGSAANHDDDTGSNPHYFVKDGAFAYWPLRQNRTGVCDEMAELFADLKAHCEAWAASDKMGWFGSKETAGFWYQEPRPMEAFQYISRRPGYLLGSAARGLSNFPTDNDVIQGSQKSTLVAAMRKTRGDAIHGRMHYWVSGVWQPTSPMSDAIVASAVKDANSWTNFAWTFEDRVRMDGCYTCDATKCECAADSEARGCWDSNVKTPSDTFDVQGSLALSNNWREHVSSRRIGSAFRKLLSGGCEVGVTGTFQRSPTANQDPAFYLHHSFTFMVNELAMRYQRDRYTPGPFFGLDTAASSDVAECAGNNYNDVTVFAHLVPYTTGQTAGARHTWDHVLRMWDFPRRHFRWVVEGEL